jgi:hypothetical protein
MLDKKEAPFGCYACESVDELDCKHCDLLGLNNQCKARSARCRPVFREDKTEVFYKAKWWYKPILFILKLRS